MGGDDAFVAELIQQFMTDAPGLVSAGRAALEAGDASEGRRAAHTLKSNAAGQLGAIAGELERVFEALRLATGQPR